MNSAVAGLGSLRLSLPADRGRAPSMRPWRPSSTSMGSRCGTRMTPGTRLPSTCTGTLRERSPTGGPFGESTTDLPSSLYRHFLAGQRSARGESTQTPNPRMENAMPAHGYVRPGEAEAARRAAKRAVQRRHAELWKDRRAEGLSFAEEGWALWYTDEAKLIREEERRKVAKEIAAEIERVIGGYPDNEEVRPKVERGGFLDDADWAAQIARRVGQGD